MCVFNMACAGVCDCDCMPFPCRSDVSNIKLKIKNKEKLKLIKRRTNRNAYIKKKHISMINWQIEYLIEISFLKLLFYNPF